MKSRNQYLKALIEKRGYLLKPKREKSRLLDEYCVTTGQNRNYVVRKINRKLNLLYQAYKEKEKSSKVEPLKKLKPNSLTFNLTQPKPISLT